MFQHNSINLNHMSQAAPDDATEPLDIEQAEYSVWSNAESGDSLIQPVVLRRSEDELWVRTLVRSLDHSPGALTLRTLLMAWTKHIPLSGT